MKKVLIMAGGTGGHIMPALAVAKELQAHGLSVHWLGTRYGLENRLIPQQQIPLHYLRVRGLRGKKLLRLFVAPLVLCWAVCQAVCLMIKLRPVVVLGMGGYIAGPGGLAAWLLRRRLVIHEQNAIAGLTNRLLANLADEVLQAYPNTFDEKFSAKTIGNPVRSELLAIASPEQRFVQRNGPLRVLVIGGSQGAQFLNNLVVASLAELAPDNRPEVWHQVGQNNLTDVEALYAEKNIAAKVSGFIEDMAQAYQWADVVLCRSGALTVAELCAVGVASILVPFPYAVDDHQTKNAQMLVDAGAALLYQQADFTAADLVAIWREFMHNSQRLQDMAVLARGLASDNAAQTVSDACLAFNSETKTHESTV